MITSSKHVHCLCSIVHNMLLISRTVSMKLCIMGKRMFVRTCEHTKSMCTELCRYISVELSFTNPC